MLADAKKPSCAESCCAGWSRTWPPLLVCFVISYTYIVFIVHCIHPQIDRAFQLTPGPLPPNDPNTYTPSQAEILGVTIGFHILFFMLLLCFLRSGTTSPGSIPLTPQEYWEKGQFGIHEDDEKKLCELIASINMPEDTLVRHRSFIKSLPVAERKTKPGQKGAQLRFCRTCNRYKPDRAHHCRICDRCILRMDHHCPWIANCVGFNNYKFFLLFLFYGSVCCAFVLGVMARRFIKCFRPVIDIHYFFKADLWIILAYLLATFLFFALFIFFCFHLSLVFNCLSTIELREKRNSDDPGIKQRWAVSHQKYDQGSAFGNFLHIFGSWYIWLLPIRSNLAGTNGTYSEVPKTA